MFTHSSAVNVPIIRMVYKRSHFAIANANNPSSRNNQDSQASNMKGSITIPMTAGYGGGFAA